jgi:hypothetical protein
LNGHISDNSGLRAAGETNTLPDMPRALTLLILAKGTLVDKGGCEDGHKGGGADGWQGAA